jgi:acetyl/propionyl-CoA carboxylase alpha subunit
MIFEIEVGGRLRTVSVEAPDAGAGGGQFSLRIDGAPHEVEARVTALGLSLIHGADGRVVDVAVSERQGGEVWLQLPHVLVPALVDARRYRRSGSGPAAVAGEAQIVAPMPGRIVRVLVQPGDEVEARQGLLVVEAMKMENEIRSPKAGRIKSVAVTAGQSVESGRLLVVVE